MKEEKLKQALHEERELFAQRGQDTTEHDVAIKYIETGYKPREYEHFELLTAVIEDFETICSDYGVKD